MILKPKERTWSRKFLDLTGSAPDFPYPDEPGPAEPGPELSDSGGRYGAGRSERGGENLE